MNKCGILTACAHVNSLINTWLFSKFNIDLLISCDTDIYAISTILSYEQYCRVGILYFFLSMKSSSNTVKSLLVPKEISSCSMQCVHDLSASLKVLQSKSSQYAIIQPCHEKTGFFHMQKPRRDIVLPTWIV